MNVILMTAHAPDSDRKTGFHFWLKTLAARGDNVDWVVVGFSLASAFKPQPRVYHPPFNRFCAIDGFASQEKTIRKFSWRPLFHPFFLPTSFLNDLLTPLFRLYPLLVPDALKHSFAAADVLIIENGAGLMLIPLIRRLNPAARIIYTVSDRMTTLGYHPLIIAAERSALAMIDLIHVPAQAMINDFPPSSKIHYTPQGLDKNAFDTPMPNPYKTPRNIISVGDMLFDSWAVETLARIAPDWNIHVFGKKAVVTNPPPNVHPYGERPFDTILPYIKYADLGMAPYRPAPDADDLSQSSLKMMQYTYCRLPIIAPDFGAAG